MFSPFITESENVTAEETLSSLIRFCCENDQTLNGWTIFKVARFAMKSGHCKVAKHLWEMLEDEVVLGICLLILFLFCRISYDDDTCHVNCLQHS